MPKRTDIKKILILGGGAVMIGQGCELDQLACQAIAALKAEGYETIFVSPNPSAVSTDPDVADKVYLEPLLPESIAKIIDEEKPDAILPTFGGQTALNLTVEMAGDILVLGADADVIARVEDRRAFKQTMERAGLPVLASEVAESIEEGLRAVRKTGFPAIIRSAYTAGGGGSAVAYNVEEFVSMVSSAIKASPVRQVLIEKAVLGWKEAELEVLRDASGNAKVVACAESVDPAGVHTGDSTVVIPAITLSAAQIEELNALAIKAVKAIGVAGVAGVRFAVAPSTGSGCSTSSECPTGEIAIMGASVCVGPLTSVSGLIMGTQLGAAAAMLAIGIDLDEALGKSGKPAADRAGQSPISPVTVKVPRFAFDRFPGADQTLGTSMKSVGEVVGTGDSFVQALQNAIGSLEVGRGGLGADGKDEDVNSESIRTLLAKPHPNRLFAVKQALQIGITADEICELSGIDKVFIAAVEELVEFEKQLVGKSLVEVPSEMLAKSKSLGYSDAQLAFLLESEEEQVRIRRKVLGIAVAPGVADAGRKVLVLGGGPNRIGQGGEFDYCRAHALRVLSAEGYEGISINSNPTSVADDFGRTIVEPQTVESVLTVIEREKPVAAILQFTGQSSLGIARALTVAGVPIWGTSIESVKRARDCRQLAQIAGKLGLKMPARDTAASADEAGVVAGKVGYPALVRAPRAVGGHAADIVYDAENLDAFLESGIELPVRIERFLEGAIEAGVDVIADGETALVCGVMEYIEQAGVHPGDSAGSLPPYSLPSDVVDRIKEASRALAKELHVRGLMGAQFAVKGDQVYLLDVRLRASRTIPFVSKATGVDWTGAATNVMLGKTLPEQGITREVTPAQVSVKETVFPFARFPNVDVVLGPEMRSTGEVIGMDAGFGAAYIKAQSAAGQNLPRGGTAFVSVSGRDKSDAVEIGKRLRELGFELVATAGTATALREAGVEVRVISKIGEGRPDAIDLIKNGEMDLIINTPSGKTPRMHEVTIRSATVARGIPIVTTMAGARATLSGMEATR